MDTQIYHKRKKEGICPICKNIDRAKTTAYCKDCIIKTQAANKARALKKLSMNICTKCTNEKLPNIQLCFNCAEKNRARGRYYNLKNKAEVLEKYGNKCVCCGESNYYFLQVDHINGGGSEHRKTIPCNAIFKFLKRNNYPKNYQLLCANCNWAKGIHGHCPHQSGLVAPVPVHPTSRKHTTFNACQ